MKKKILTLIFILTIFAGVFSSCGKEKPEKPEDPTAMKFLTRANRDFELNKFTSAITNYKKSLKLLKYKNNREAANKYLNQSYIQIARESFNNASWQKAINYYNKAIEHQEYEMSKDLKSTLYVERGLCQAQMTNYNKAIESYKKALDLTPKGKKIRFHMGNAYMSRRKFDLAITEYKKEIAINPDMAESYSNLGSAYVAINQNKRAIKYFQQAIKKNDNYYKAYQNLASAYSNIGEYGKAIKTYDQLLKKNPNMKEAYVFMAEIYMIIRDQKKAYDYLKKALEKGYNNWNYLLNYSRGLRTAKEYGWFKKLIKKYRKK